MIPEFTEQGFLPPGIHQATLAEFKERFVVFQRSDRRFHIFEHLQNLFEQAARSGIVRRIIIAGSFITAQSEPNDFDCIIVLDSSIVGKLLRPFEYNLAACRREICSRQVRPCSTGAYE
jgi:predicted metal-dependent HD superfamily phosphohydrolase